MTPLSLAQIVAGLAVLTVGANLLVRGASALASRFGVSPLVIGLTVVAFGTSAPELAVSVGAAVGGHDLVALGNMVGSNIFNVLFILGLSAIVVPLLVDPQLIRRDLPVMIAVSALPIAFGLDGVVGRPDGLFLLGGALTYVLFLWWLSRRTGEAPGASPGGKGTPAALGMRPALAVGSVAGGLVMLVFGGGWLVAGATEVARALGISELVIGLTVVAAGTSLPEVATSLTAGLKGERDIAVGNVVGSNIFNVLVVLGAASAVTPDGLTIPRGALTFDLPLMLGFAVVCLPIFITGKVISRLEGSVLLGFYIIYVGYLALDATDHPANDLLGVAILYFMVPLAVLVIVVDGWLARQRALRGEESGTNIGA